MEDLKRKRDVLDVMPESKRPRPAVLSREVREGLAIVIQQMASDLPSPIDRILTLYLPPDFAQRDENTLGYILRQETLTWEQLVTILHVFSKNLLVPCAYPNPVPSLAHFHLPVPPLPSHFPPHKIYSFCEALSSLLSQIEPNAGAGLESERWGLVQKVPGTQGASDWFSGNVDAREVDALLSKSKEQGTLLEQLASRGDRFGHAYPIATQSTTGGPSTARVLGDTVLQKASLKMKQWKEARGKRLGGFGSVVKTTMALPVRTSFGPSFDSSYGSYDDTMAGMHERARVNEWRQRPLVLQPGYMGDEIGGNAALLEELQTWQDVRVKRGQELPGERELLVADELFASLGKLAEQTAPRDFTQSSAHAMSKIIPVGSPSLRGTLDPKRPHALHDNLTVKPQSQSRYPSSYLARRPPSALRQSYAPGLYQN